jgi:hypothetical protein
MDKSSKSSKSTKTYKAQILLDLFFSMYDATNPQERIEVSIDEVVECCSKLQIARPGNIHNFFKDIVRSGKMPKSLAQIADLGYLIVQLDRGGAFIKGENDDTVILPDDLSITEIQASCIPIEVIDLVRTDEGGVLSVVEYCGILDLIAGAKVYRVQSPVKVFPNEIDGLYAYKKNDKRIIFTAEAKSKGGDVILKHQIYGAASKALEFFGNFVDAIIPLGIKIGKDNTIYIVVFDKFSLQNLNPAIKKIYRYKVNPLPPNWSSSPRQIRERRAQLPLL